MNQLYYFFKPVNFKFTQLKETREFKSASNDQAFPVEASIENEVESPPVEKKVQEGIKIDINKLFGTSVNTSEASKSVTASVVSFIFVYYFDEFNDISAYEKLIFI